jgi:hypothetical protein
MKNTLLLFLACSFLVGCSSTKQDSELSDNQKTTLAQFTSAVTIALQTMDAKTIFNRGNRSMPKAVADEVKNCDYKPDRDGSGRLVGNKVGGAFCPIRAEWWVRSNGASSATIDLSYRSENDEFTQLLPVALLTLDGTRSSLPFGGRYQTTTQYRGTARDTSDDVVSFEITIKSMTDSAEGFMTLSDYSYTIKVNFNGFTAEGKIIDYNKFTLNGAEISRSDFENFFFILK